jgi:replicative DNA helicase
MYNFEALALKALMDGKSEIIPDLSPEFFTDKYVRLYTLCLEFFQDNKKLPNYLELSAIIDAKAPVAVKGAYQAILKNIDSISENAEPQVILSELRNLTTLRRVDEDIEALTMAAKDKNIAQVQLLLNKLHSKVNLRGIVVSDMADAKGAEDSHTMVRSFLDKDSEDEFLGGGMSGLSIVSAVSGGGKALSNDTYIPNINGKKCIAELAVGDQVYGRDGRLTKVTGVYPQGVRPTYKVTCRDGRSVLADAEHIWTVHSRIKRGEFDVTTEEMYKNLYTPRYDKRYSTYHKTMNYSIPLPMPIEYQKNELVVAPYILGALIGDGGLSQNTMNFTTADAEMIDNISQYLPSSATITKLQSPYGYNIKYPKYLDYIKSIKLNVTSAHKFIPKEYLVASIDDRINLLRGLLDTDGYIGRGSSSIEYVTVSEQLSSDVVELVRSLGGVAKVMLKSLLTYKYKGEIRPCKQAYRISIRFSNGINPFMLSRKSSILIKSNKLNYISVTSIEKVDDVECTCIEVDAPDHLYVTGSYMVTHNTVALLKAAINNYRDGKNVLLVTLELPKAVLYQRLISNISGVEFGRIIKKQVTPEEQALLDKAHDEFFNPSNPNYFKIVDDSINDAELLNLIAVEAQLNGLDVVVLDYIQLVDLGGSGDEWRGLSSLAKKLHKLTRTYGVTIITASQVNVEGKIKGTILPNITTRGSRELEFSSTQFVHLDIEPETNGLIMYTKKNRLAECRHVVLEKDFAHMDIRSTGMALN